MIFVKIIIHVLPKLLVMLYYCMGWGYVNKNHFCFLLRVKMMKRLLLYRILVQYTANDTMNIRLSMIHNSIIYHGVVVVDPHLHACLEVSPSIR